MSRVLLAGDNTTSLAEVRALFEVHGAFSLCGEVHTIAGIMQKAEQLKPCLIILDFADWFAEGLHAAEALKRKLPKVHLFLLTGSHSFDFEREAVSRGIDAVFAKDEGLGTLLSNACAACDLEWPGDITANEIQD